MSWYIIFYNSFKHNRIVQIKIFSVFCVLKVNSNKIKSQNKTDGILRYHFHHKYLHYQHEATWQ